MTNLDIYNPTKVRKIVEDLEQQLAARDERIRELERQVTNLTSTVEAWNHAEIIKCGCKYNKVWGGMKWEHWLSPCKEHREREQQLRAAQERLAEAEYLLNNLKFYDRDLILLEVKEYFAKHANPPKPRHGEPGHQCNVDPNEPEPFI